MVMHYIPDGNLRQYLKSHYSKLNLNHKLQFLRDTARGLKDIHNKGFIHKDLHSGNILNEDQFGKYSYITDLGLCKPVDEQGEEKIHGVLPYVAPEVLRGKKYTPSADIYSFGIIACEILSGLPPYHNLPHNEFLTLKICQGLRPKVNNVKVPPLLENLIDQCLDADPLKRPTADKLLNIIDNWLEEIDNNKYNKDEDIEFSEFYKQYKEAEELNESITSKSKIVSSSSYTIHSQAIYTSRLLDYKNLPEPQNSKEINIQFYTEFSGISFPKLILFYLFILY